MEKHIWPYEAYSDWSRLIAKNYTADEIKKVIGITDSKREALSKKHLNAINKSTSMGSNSQARAQSRNSMSGNYAKLKAHEDALELHEVYPQKCKCEGYQSSFTPNYQSDY